MQLTIDVFSLLPDIHCILRDYKVSSSHNLCQGQGFKKRSFRNIEILNKLFLVLSSFSFGDVLCDTAYSGFHLANESEVSVGG
jgi:hypothetical protein